MNCQISANSHHHEATTRQEPSPVGGSGKPAVGALQPSIITMFWPFATSTSSLGVFLAQISQFGFHKAKGSETSRKLDNPAAFSRINLS